MGRTITSKIVKGKLEKVYETDDELTTYKHLANALIAKKINKCAYIKRIVRSNHFNGTQSIYVYGDGMSPSTSLTSERR